MLAPIIGTVIDLASVRGQLLLVNDMDEWEVLQVLGADVTLAESFDMAPVPHHSYVEARVVFKPHDECSWLADPWGWFWYDDDLAGTDIAVFFTPTELDDMLCVDRDGVVGREYPAD